MTARRRAPHGARGLKSIVILRRHQLLRRAPHGARGLKFICHVGELRHQQSRPARGAWIEMARRIPCTTPHGVAPRTGRVD